jgi:hypothetical protein
MQIDLWSEIPDYYLWSVAKSLLKDFANAKTPERITELEKACLQLGRLINNSITPLIRNPPVNKSTADIYHALGDRLLDVVHPLDKRELILEFRECDSRDVVADNVENLTIQIRQLCEEIRERKTRRKVRQDLKEAA